MPCGSKQAVRKAEPWTIGSKPRLNYPKRRKRISPKYESESPEGDASGPERHDRDAGCPAPIDHVGHCYGLISAAPPPTFSDYMLPSSAYPKFEHIHAKAGIQ
jgi:hypothetical protein